MKAENGKEIKMNVIDRRRKTEESFQSQLAAKALKGRKITARGNALGLNGTPRKLPHV